MASKLPGFIPKDPKSYARATVAAGVGFFILNSVANRVPVVDKVRRAIFNGK